MPFATCRRCQSVFIVGSGEEAGDYNKCPYCGTALEAAESADVIRRITEQRAEDEDSPPHPDAPLARQTMCC
jgi:hypothetical protein